MILSKRTIAMASMAGLMLMSMPTECAARQWSLKDCIDYALANNIQLQKAICMAAKAALAFSASPSRLVRAVLYFSISAL